MLYFKQRGCKPTDFNKNFNKSNNKMSGQIVTLLWPFLRFFNESYIAEVFTKETNTCLLTDET